jgi:hypothetical protein
MAGTNDDTTDLTPEDDEVQNAKSRADFLAWVQDEFGGKMDPEKLATVADLSIDINRAIDKRIPIEIGQVLMALAFLLDSKCHDLAQQIFEKVQEEKGTPVPQQDMIDDLLARASIALSAMAETLPCGEVLFIFCMVHCVNKFFTKSYINKHIEMAMEQ